MSYMYRRSQPMPRDCARLLETVPEWFGIPEANAGYVAAAESLETWIASDAQGTVVALALVDQHFPETSELHLIVVDRAHQGEGIGTALLDHIGAELRARGVRLLEVKTLGASDPDPHYARTRHFYERRGFLRLEETQVWGPDSPCLIMVKPLQSTY